MRESPGNNRPCVGCTEAGQGQRVAAHSGRLNPPSSTHYRLPRPPLAWKLCAVSRAIANISSGSGPASHEASRATGNPSLGAQGVLIPKPNLAQVGLEGTADLQVRDGVIEIRAVRRNPREGWADDARRLAGQGGDALVWPEVANEGDDELVW
jgi:antitoxin MazE